MLSHTEIDDLMKYPIQPPDAFMTQRERLDWVLPVVMNEAGGSLWDLILEYKNIAEKRDFVKPIVDKFKAMPCRALGIGLGLTEYEQTEYCKENKIARSYNGNGVGFFGGGDDIMTVRIVFHHFNRKIPKASKLPAWAKGRGITWALVRDCWDEEDKNLYLIAKAFGDGYYKTPKRFMKSFARKGIEYTGMPQFIQMAIDLVSEESRLREEAYKRQRELFVTMKLIP